MCCVSWSGKRSSSSSRLWSSILSTLSWQGLKVSLAVLIWLLEYTIFNLEKYGCASAMEYTKFGFFVHCPLSRRTQSTIVDILVHSDRFYLSALHGQLIPNAALLSLTDLQTVVQASLCVQITGLFSTFVRERLFIVARHISASVGNWGSIWPVIRTPIVIT